MWFQTCVTFFLYSIKCKIGLSKQNVHWNWTKYNIYLMLLFRIISMCKIWFVFFRFWCELHACMRFTVLLSVFHISQSRREGLQLCRPCFRGLLLCCFLLRALHCDPDGVCADLRGPAQTGQTHRTFTQTRPPSRAQRWTEISQGVLGITRYLINIQI